MKENNMTNKKNKVRKSVVFLVLTCLALIIILLVKITENQPKVENVNDDNTKVQEISDEEKLQKDSQDEKILNVFRSLRWEEGYSFGTFTELKQEMVELSTKNLFAKKFVEMSESVPYNDYDEVRRMAFDTYLKLLFRHYAAMTGNTLGKFVEAWSGDYKKFNTSVLFLKLEQDQMEVLDKIDYFDVRYDRNNGEIYQKSVEGALFKNKNSRIIYFTDSDSTATLYDFSADVSIYKPVKIFKAVNVKRKLNKMLVHNKEFIEFLISYRDDVYVPTLEEEAKAREEEQEELKRQQEIEEQQRQIEKERFKMPRIGMTAEEVRKTKWGNPNRINRDTYAWGIREQWVYNDRGYVYFEDGIVTSISERQ